MNKNDFKKSLVILSASFCLCACGTEEVENLNSVKETESDVVETVAETTESMETESEESVEEVVATVDDSLSLEERSRKAYQDLLMAVIETGGFPEELVNEGDVFLFEEDADDTSFAIIDVDQDGKEELIVSMVSSNTSNICAWVFGYDEEKNVVFLEVSEGGTIAVYENGGIRFDFTHNQGVAGSFWPYMLYQYDAKTDTYQYMGYVDAFDRVFVESGESSFIDVFPEEVDEDQNGFVYYIEAPGYGGYDNPCDDDVYEAWQDQATDGSKEVTLDLIDVNEENVSAIR